MGTSTASFKARALMRFDRDVRPARSECSAKLQSEEAARVPLVDLRFVRVAGPYPLHGLDGIADEPRSLLGIEREIRAEQHMIGAEEGEPALHGVPGPEQRGVAVEHPEVVDGPPLEPSERAAVLGVVAPGTQLVQPAADSPLAERDHRTQVMRDDDETGVAIEEAGEDEAPHGHARLIRPAERPPEIV